MNPTTRRKFLRWLASLPPVLGLPLRSSFAKAGHDKQAGWKAGQLVHLIPTANHESFLIKTSFLTSLTQSPVLKVGDRTVTGKRTDTRGYFWQFFVDKLEANTTYQLQVFRPGGSALCDPWPLKTFPRPGAPVDSCRILAYTCAGGHEDIALEDGTSFFLPLATRQRLLEKGLSFQPDLVIANGDHIYWDQLTLLSKSPELVKVWHKLYEKIGTLDRNLPVLGTENEIVLKQIVDPQIAQLYGTRLRSTPTYMLTDDHDLFENDEASEELISLPPSKHSLEAARATQHLYYPEFLQDDTRPVTLPGSSAADRLPGLSEVFGTIRYGKLLEALLYDTKRYVSLNGTEASMVPAEVEKWLQDRTSKEETRHFMHMPSTPVGWSAGKWGEWYPDILQADGTLGTEETKPYWPTGWWQQHQRLLAGLSSQLQRTALVVSGDLHNFAAGKITRSGRLDLASNPVNSICVGPLGSGTPVFPSSSFRQTGSLPASQLQMEETMPPLEKNGFTIIDITANKIEFKMYAWRPPQALSEIDELEPISIIAIAKKNVP